MNTITTETRLEESMMEALDLVHMDDINKYLDEMKDWTVDEVKEACVMVTLYTHKKFDISKPDAFKVVKSWIHSNNKI